MKYSEIADRFREKINDNDDYIFRKYSEESEKNQWHCICSAMDWLTVATRYIDYKKKYSDNIDEMSIEVYSFISAIDIIWESIKQLHRVIVNRESIPFAGDQRIFNDTRLSKDDNEYFKHIRAAFGAHSVNLSDDVRRFASWPTNHVYTEFDLAVILYSSDKKMPDVVFGFKFEQLYHFLDTRIAYLDEILNTLAKQYEDFCTEMRAKKIECSNDIINQLTILEKEEKLRFDNDYYHDTITKVRFFFEIKSTCPKNDQKIKNWRKQLIPIINEIFDNLQNMRIEDLETEFFFDLIRPDEVRYAYSKLSEQVHGSPYYISVIPEIISFINQYLHADETMSLNELYLLANVSSYLYSKEKGVI